MAFSILPNSVSSAQHLPKLILLAARDAQLRKLTILLLDRVTLELTTPATVAALSAVSAYH